jgi:ribosomal-protein-alanine N-acetyltransferase
LEVRAGNAGAQALYRKFGYEEAGRRPRYYKDNGEDAILMTLEPLNVNSQVSKV